ncbi:tubulin monoglycylase TTLL3 [Poecilia reticulata]|uniref:Tubulin tyrosine ligase like 3 n=1 Tax=Poecilia reticulata TaxID=8081 RepID=A0A3P9PWR2_POERE|nr:PREDICTED: tubulin monoglycylase TTLL3-like [Poecilia reticulata]XP_008407830.1 PREDICTED: tubulin monoglycylase TTLL3-like [Poecilia reticulata]
MKATDSAKAVILSLEKLQDGKEHSLPYPCNPPEIKVGLPDINPGRVKLAKSLVEKAVKMHKIFTIQGPYPVIRAALKARGWIEQRMPQQVQQRLNSDSRSNDAEEDNSEETEKEKEPDRLHSLMSRLVRNEMVYFYWTNRRDAISTNNLQKEQIVNHFAKAGSFTTKAGLCVNLRNLHWFDTADPDSFFPRCYKLAARDEKQAFIEDYRRTACTSLLKYVVEKDQNIQWNEIYQNFQDVQWLKKQNKLRCKRLVPSETVTTALKVCQEYLESLEHGDIDKSLEALLTQEQWEGFLNSYYLVAHGGAHIEKRENFVSSCKAMLQKLEKVSPQLGIDGTQNIWIIKPGAKSRGRGIKCEKRLDQILRLVNIDPTLIKESKWVVQKYIEKPFLIHDTKFDVRQWFLVTDWNPLTVWFYKKCYLRFSTQPYSLDTLDSSVHLCNNSIQKHLRPSHQRHHCIPPHNMWLDDQFKAFLASQGKDALWETVVVPGMKTTVIHALQTAQDLIESRKNTFELYGADFMLDLSLHPWLIEINASPTMAPSTCVTAQLCTAVQEDTLRVVLDRRVDRSANTGDFQLIYRQAAVEVPQYLGINLVVEGVAVKNPCVLPPLKSSQLSSSKRWGAVKEKESAPEKVQPLPKVIQKAQENKTSSEASPALPPEPSISRVAIHLPVTVLSVDGGSNFEHFSKKHAEVLKVQPTTATEKKQASLRLVMFNPNSPVK